MGKQKYKTTLYGHVVLRYQCNGHKQFILPAVANLYSSIG